LGNRIVTTAGVLFRGNRQIRSSKTFASCLKGSVS
jgi:hypothetical protein